MIESLLDNTEILIVKFQILIFEMLKFKKLTLKTDTKIPKFKQLVLNTEIKILEIYIVNFKYRN